MVNKIPWFTTTHYKDTYAHTHTHTHTCIYVVIIQIETPAMSPLFFHWLFIINVNNITALLKANRMAQHVCKLNR